jgi:isochorismate synthase
MRKHKKLHTPGWLEDIVNSRSAFVISRFPGETEPVLQIPAHVRKMAPDAFINCLPFNGFVFSPFATDRDLILFEGHSVLPEASVVAEEPFDDGTDGHLLSGDGKLYCRRVEALVRAMDKAEVQKVVFSGARCLEGSGEEAAAGLFRRLCKSHPAAMVYLARIPDYGLWAGATPEVLIHYNDDVITSMALAGTKKAGISTDWSGKEYEEHFIVSDYIQGLFREARCSPVEIRGPYDTLAGQLVHLRTDFSAHADIVSAARLAQMLHPTPAVCGVPVGEALRLISLTEGYQRTLYTGFLGRITNQSLWFFVNLRCARLSEHQAVLYAGGGITRSSVPVDEWHEARLKSETIAQELKKLKNFAAP